eukprot:2071700-Amphidinium_carterae.1
MSNTTCPSFQAASKVQWFPSSSGDWDIIGIGIAGVQRCSLESLRRWARKSKKIGCKILRCLHALRFFTTFLLAGGLGYTLANAVKMEVVRLVKRQRKTFKFPTTTPKQAGRYNVYEMWQEAESTAITDHPTSC